MALGRLRRIKECRGGRKLVVLFLRTRRCKRTQSLQSLRGGYRLVGLSAFLLFPGGDRAQVIHRQMRQGPAGNPELEVERDRPRPTGVNWVGARIITYADNPGQIRTRAGALEAGKLQAP